jgi:citrate lyase beta subunit
MSTPVRERLARANREFNEKYPGESGERQPVHVVYGGANLFKADTPKKLATLAQKAFREYAPDASTLVTLLGMPAAVAGKVHARIADKLQREAIEDFRIDFEDGYGIRSDAAEDADATSAATETAKALKENALPPFFGFRVKPLSEELHDRSLRTLHRFLSTLLEQTGGKLPHNFVVTLPKITVPEQVEALMAGLEQYPNVSVELMAETPQMIFSLPKLVELCEGRCVGVHFGPYDYTSSLGITSTNQHLLHPGCEFARMMMQVSLAGTGIWLSDGPTTTMPIPPHRGEGLSEQQKSENRDVVYRAWKLHYSNVRHALSNGFYQGWDLHPAQFPMRYAALYAFFVEGLDAASERLRNFVEKAAQGTRIGDVFDDAATGQGLLNYFLRAMSCGAIPADDVPALTGLTLEQLRTASFTKILKELV